MSEEVQAERVRRSSLRNTWASSAIRWIAKVDAHADKRVLPVVRL